MPCRHALCSARHYIGTNHRSNASLGGDLPLLFGSTGSCEDLGGFLADLSAEGEPEREKR